MAASLTELEPFIEAHRQALAGAITAQVARLLGPAGESGDVRWNLPGAAHAEGRLLEVQLALASGGVLRLRLHPPDSSERAWRQLEGASLSYAGGREPVGEEEARERSAVLAELGAHLDAHPDTRATVGELRAGLTAWREAQGARDHHYRQLSASQRGAYGMLRLGFRCSQDCHFCWPSRRWPDPPRELFERWLDQMAAAGVERVELSGGEPTLYRHLVELVEHASKDLGLTVAMETNAIALSKPALLDALVDAGLDRLLVSLHSADPEVSDRMTRARGTFWRTVEGLEASLAAGLVVSLNCVVEASNVEGLEAHARFVLERFVAPCPDSRLMHVVYTHPSHYWEADHFEAQSLPFDRVRPHLRRAARLLLEAGVQVDAAGTCGFPPCVVAGEPRLIAVPHPADLDDGDTSGRTFLPRCDACAARPFCLGLRAGYVDRWGPRGVEPIAALPEDVLDRAARGTLELPKPNRST